MKHSKPSSTSCARRKNCLRNSTAQRSPQSQTTDGISHSKLKAVSLKQCGTPTNVKFSGMNSQLLTSSRFSLAKSQHDQGPTTCFLPRLRKPHTEATQRSTGQNPTRKFQKLSSCQLTGTLLPLPSSGECKMRNGASPCSKRLKS
jgi:hypothetical protein